MLGRLSAASLNESSEGTLSTVGAEQLNVRRLQIKARCAACLPFPAQLDDDVARPSRESLRRWHEASVFVKQTHVFDVDFAPQQPILCHTRFACADRLFLRLQECSYSWVVQFEEDVFALGVFRPGRRIPRNADVQQAHFHKVARRDGHVLLAARAALHTGTLNDAMMLDCFSLSCHQLFGCLAARLRVLALATGPTSLPAALLRASASSWVPAGGARPPRQVPVGRASGPRSLPVLRALASD